MRQLNLNSIFKVTVLSALTAIGISYWSSESVFSPASASEPSPTPSGVASPAPDSRLGQGDKECCDCKSDNQSKVAPVAAQGATAPADATKAGTAK
jgi:hypothetical protein